MREFKEGDKYERSWQPPPKSHTPFKFKRTRIEILMVNETHAQYRTSYNTNDSEILNIENLGKLDIKLRADSYVKVDDWSVDEEIDPNEQAIRLQDSSPPDRVSGGRSRPSYRRR